MDAGQRHLPGMPVPAPPYPGPPGVVLTPQVIQNIQHPAPQLVTQQPQFIQPVNNIMMVGQQLTDKSGRMVCPYCQKIVVTQVQYRNGDHAYLICFLLGMFLLWPFCLIPLCCISCKDAEHYCPNCKHILHIYKRS